WHTLGVDGEHKSVKCMKFADYLRYLIYVVFLCVFSIGFNYITASADNISTGLITGITFTANIMSIEKFMENRIVWIISDLYF
ncbi:nicotinamide ribonucleoside (NR) uptake permease (PnuC) family protein, partial [Francisella tularensis subsp. holarctica]|nr:nicotinamide ribonucleoside (NR) uptake permease (PnuC) family protein [Francisella tularensis subsp. holarctica]